MSAHRSTEAQGSDSHVGFISIVDLGNDAMIGGYLILNQLARPVEFHCTEPVRPNRAQQILYGQTLKPFLCGDQIGMALVEHAAMRPQLLCTDVAEVASLRRSIAIPLLVTPQATGATGDLQPIESSSMGGFIHPQYPDDAALCVQLFEHQLDGWDVSEPFQRIHEALSEIQKAA